MNEIFINNEDDIPKDFLKIETISSIIGGCKYYQGVPITFDYNQSDDSVIIIQKNHYGRGSNESLLRFFNNYNYTKGYKHLLLNTNIYINYLKIFNTGENLSIGWNLNTTIYISKSYLSNIYNIDYLPDLFYLILSHNFKRIIHNMVDIKSYINYPINLNKTELVKKYKIKHFKHQIDNIQWMINLEDKIKSVYEIETYKIPNKLFNTILYYLKIINNYIIVNNEGKLIKLDNMEKIKLYPKGGVLSDDVGLGKTFSILSLINERKNGCSLVLCPKRLIKNWEDEINNNIFDLKYKAIYTITHWKKINNDTIKNYDLIIVPYNLLINKNYMNHSINCFNILDYTWNRIVLDEGHEFISRSKSIYLKNITKTNYNSIKSYIKKIKANYYWLCSATPFSNYYDYWQVIEYIFGYKLEIEYSSILNFDKNAYRKTNITNIHHMIYDLTQKLFIKNKKDSIEVYIPRPIMKNHFLKQSTMEKIIYDGEDNKYKKIQLCSHVLVSEDNINILGKNPLSFEEIYNKMDSHYSNKIEKMRKEILNKLKTKKNKNTDIVNLEKELNSNEFDITTIKLPINNEYMDFSKISDKLKLLKYKREIFDNLKIEIGYNECSICYESFEDIQKGILHCGHYFCVSCIKTILKKSSFLNCPVCRLKSDKNSINIIKIDGNIKNGNKESKWGTKILNIIDYIESVQLGNSDAKFMIFSQWDNMLKLISKILDEYDMGYIFINGSAYNINNKILSFKLDSKIKIVLISSDKNVSGLHLPEVNYIILLDTFNTDSVQNCQIIEEQAIGRSYRIGQKNQIYVNRFIMKDTIEEEYFNNNCL